MPAACSSEAVAESLPLPVLGRLQREAGTPFNLVQGPLVRALLVKLGSEDNLLLLTLHHAICDGTPSRCVPDAAARQSPEPVPMTIKHQRLCAP